MSLTKRYVMRNLHTQCYYNRRTKKFDGNIATAELFNSKRDCEMTLEYDIVTSKGPHFNQGLIHIEYVYAVDL